MFSISVLPVVLCFVPQFVVRCWLVCVYVAYFGVVSLLVCFLCLAVVVPRFYPHYSKTGKVSGGRARALLDLATKRINDTRPSCSCLINALSCANLPMWIVMLLLFPPRAML